MCQNKLFPRQIKSSIRRIRNSINFQRPRFFPLSANEDECSPESWKVGWFETNHWNLRSLKLPVFIWLDFQSFAFFLPHRRPPRLLQGTDTPEQFRWVQTFFFGPNLLSHALHLPLFLSPSLWLSLFPSHSLCLASLFPLSVALSFFLPLCLSLPSLALSFFLSVSSLLISLQLDQ